MNHSTPRICHHWRTIATIALLSLQAACFVPHAQMVRDAQDAFSKGAELDNRAKLGIGEDLPGADPYYSTAYGLIQQALRKSEAKLISDDLYGTAMTIKALAAWQLGDLETAKKTASAVVKLATGSSDSTKVWPRDHAVCLALKGLISIDVLAVAVANVKTADELQSLVFKEVDGINSSIKNAAVELPEAHPLRLYLTQARAELARVVHRGIANVFPRGQHKTAQADKYRSLRQEVLDEMEAQLESDLFVLMNGAIEKAITRYKGVKQADGSYKKGLLGTVTDGV